MNDFGRFFIGYDKVAETLANIAGQSAKLVQNYPPFNIKKVEENKYAIEIALAGFSMQDIDIEIEDGNLIITGNTNSNGTEAEYVWRGISNKAFMRKFALADGVQVLGAEFLDGLLTISLEAITHKTTKKKVGIKGAKANV